jgi:hypothetical protein|nr:MAG TPA_asm: holin [Caudoviricetes sp.]
MLDGIKNFIQFINDNWTAILVIISVVIAIVQKVRSYFAKSKDERINIVKAQIQEIVLKLVSDAETDYKDWKKSGSIKRVQVIQKIFADYPILSKVANQDELIKWIDDNIDEALRELHKVVTQEKEKKVSDNITK